MALETIILHFKEWGWLYLTILLIIFICSIIFLLFRIIVFKGRFIHYTIFQNDGGRVTGKVNPKLSHFQKDGAEYLIDKKAIRTEKRFFGSQQFLLYFMNIPEPIDMILSTKGISAQTISGVVLKEILEHKIIKEMLEVGENKVNWVLIVIGIVIFLIIAGVIFFIATKK